MTKHLTSLQNAHVKQAVKLHSSRGRKQQGRIIIFGQREICRAVDAGLAIEELFLPSSDHENVILPTAKHVFVCADEVMKKLQYGQRETGWVATAIRPATDLKAFSDRLQSRDSDNNLLIIVLEAVEKPGNLGAIVRSIDAAGADGLILSQPLTDVFHPNAIRSSTGVLFRLPVATGSNQQVQAWLGEHSLTVVTARLQDSTDFYDLDLTENLAIVLGNEAEGLSETWCDGQYQSVRLPMQGQADSLNVSVTASVMLFEAYRQRRF